jgi:hypothetical protein
MLVIVNTHRKIRKRTDTVIAFTREYSRVSVIEPSNSYKIKYGCSHKSRNPHVPSLIRTR